MLKFVTYPYPGGNNNTWCQDQLNWFSWAECAKDCECLLGWTKLVSFSEPNLRRRMKAWFASSVWPWGWGNSIGICWRGQLSWRVLMQWALMFFQWFLPTGFHLAVIFLLTELFLQNFTFCGAKSKSKRSASVRYFSTTWCLEHHGFQRLQNIPNWLATWDAESFVCGISPHFPLSGHVEIRGFKASNHYVEPWWLGVRLQFRVLHPSPRRPQIFDPWCLADLAANKRCQKGLCSRVEYDSDKGKGNSNYKHGYIIYIVYKYIYTYIYIYYTISICIYIYMLHISAATAT